MFCGLPDNDDLKRITYPAPLLLNLHGNCLPQFVFVCSNVRLQFRFGIAAAPCIPVGTDDSKDTSNHCTRFTIWKHGLPGFRVDSNENQKRVVLNVIQPALKRAERISTWDSNSFSDFIKSFSQNGMSMVCIVLYRCKQTFLQKPFATEWIK